MDISLAEKVEAFASSRYALEHLLTHAIDRKGNLLLISSMADFLRAREKNFAIRVLHMEEFNLKIRMICEHLRGVHDHIGPISCTAVIANRGAPSNDWHTEDVGVWMKVLRGQKLVQYENGVNSTDFSMAFDQSVFVAAGTKFRTVNKDSSITLVVRFEQFMEEKAL